MQGDEDKREQKQDTETGENTYLLEWECAVWGCDNAKHNSWIVEK